MDDTENILVDAYIAAGERGAYGVLPQSNQEEQADFFIWLSAIAKPKLWDDLLPQMSSDVLQEAFVNAASQGKMQTLEALSPMIDVPNVLGRVWRQAAFSVNLPVLQFVHTHISETFHYKEVVLGAIRHNNPSAIRWGLDEILKLSPHGLESKFVTVALLDALRSHHIDAAKSVLPYCGEDMINNLVQTSLQAPHMLGDAHTVLEKVVLEWNLDSLEPTTQSHRRKI